jgi:Domain of unknown function (DUF5658)
MLYPAFATRRLRPSVCALTLMLIGVAGVRSAHAEGEGQDTPGVKSVELSPAADVQPSLDVHSPTPPTRGPIFATLEASYIGLQALDIASTLSALDKGYVEANPMMRGLTAHPAALVAVKAAATGGTVLLARRIAGRNRMAGILLTAALDGAYSYIVVRNFALAAAPTRR